MIKYLTTTFLLLVPALLYAQGELTRTETLIRRVGDLVQSLVTVVMGMALLVFFWGIVKYIFAQGNEQVQADGKKIMFWGIIGLFVMSSVWGIIGFIQRDLDLPETVNRTRTLEDGCGPRSQGYLVECDNQFDDF